MPTFPASQRMAGSPYPRRAQCYYYFLSAPSVFSTSIASFFHRVAKSISNRTFTEQCHSPFAHGFPGYPQRDRADAQRILYFQKSPSAMRSLFSFIGSEPDLRLLHPCLGQSYASGAFFRVLHSDMFSIQTVGRPPSKLLEGACRNWQERRIVGGASAIPALSNPTPPFDLRFQQRMHKASAPTSFSK